MKTFLRKMKALNPLSLPGITGIVAAYVRSRHREPSFNKP